jgi:tRNA nucleotidyltransferase (CCA-adding enzyme)
MGPAREIDIGALGARIAALPGASLVRDAARSAGVDAYVVGGAVRDALLGEQRSDLDVVVDGNHRTLLEALGGDVRSFDRFETAKLTTAEGTIDVTRARTESYPHPGALPEVQPGGLAGDLARRDFTINAMAVPVAAPEQLIDPQGGLADLRAGLLRILHPNSFVDDPTRALRAARYAARFGFELEEDTRRALERTDLTTISADRTDSELRRLAAESDPRAGFELLDAWKLVSLPPDMGQLIGELARLLAEPPWQGVASAADAIVAAVRGVPQQARELAAADPGSPSEAVAAAQGYSGVELALARAAGASWLDRYVGEWRAVRPSISGDDLLAAGVEEGPAVGRGLEAALRAKLDGVAADRESELEIALRAARA